jgi:hypothetical protein
MIQSSEDIRPLTAEEIVALAKFARLEISLEQLLEELHGKLEIDFGETRRRLTPRYPFPEPGIRIEKNLVQDVQARHSRGEVSKKQLTEWATMLMLNEVYVWDGPDEDEISDLLNGLSTSTHGEK